MIKTFPGIVTYFGKNEQHLIRQIETIAQERGISASFFMRQCALVGLELCTDPKNRNALRPRGNVVLSLVPVSVKKKKAKK